MQRLPVLIALAIAAAKIGLDWSIRLSVEMQATMYGDSYAYFAMGRALLNGLTPYKDLLEIKPPGIFFITAFSYVLTGDEMVAVTFQWFALFCLPFLLPAAVAFLLRGEQPYWRIVLSLQAFIVGGLMTLTMVEKAGGVQVEPFGVFFGFLFVVAYVWAEGAYGFRVLAPGLMLLCAVALKEPFVLTLAASALLLSRSFRTFFRTFGLSLAFAAAAGLLIMLVLGYLGPYLSVYLPAVLGDRIQQGAPLWSRALVTEYLFLNIYTYSPLPLLGLALLTLWMAYPLYGRIRFTGNDALLTAGTAAAGTFFLYRLSRIIQLLQELSFASWPMENPFVSSFTWWGVAAAILFGGALALLFRQNAPAAQRVLWAIVALILCTLAVGAGNFLGQHYLFAVPTYLALFIVYALHAPRSEDAVALAVTGIVTVLLIAAPFARTPLDAQKALAAQAERLEWMERAKLYAAEIDRVLDACAWDRYVSINDSAGWSAFTLHSPYEIGWTYLRAFGRDPHPVMRERYFGSLGQAAVVVAERATLASVTDLELLRRLNAGFSTEIPSCARPYVSGALEFHFRVTRTPAVVSGGE